MSSTSSQWCGIRMDFKETEVVEARFYGMVNTHIASKMILTQSNYFLHC